MVARNVHSVHVLLLVAALAVQPFPSAAHPGPHARIESLTSALDQRPGDAGLWIERAVEYHLDGDFGAALRDLDRAESLAPARAEVARVRATVLLALGRAHPRRGARRGGRLLRGGRVPR